MTPSWIPDTFHRPGQVSREPVEHRCRVVFEEEGGGFELGKGRVELHGLVNDRSSDYSPIHRARRAAPRKRTFGNRTETPEQTSQPSHAHSDTAPMERLGNLGVGEQVEPV